MMNMAGYLIITNVGMNGPREFSFRSRDKQQREYTLNSTIFDLRYRFLSILLDLIELFLVSLVILVYRTISLIYDAPIVKGLVCKKHQKGFHTKQDQS